MIKKVFGLWCITWCLIGCEAYKPFDLPDLNEGPGLFSGPDGKFELNIRKPEQNKTEECEISQNK
jgi:hypothetical protein